MTGFLDDLRQAWKALCRAPGFTSFAVLVLALGVGTSVAIFSVVNAVLLRPLPFPDPDRLAMVYATALEKQERRPVSPLNYVDVLARQHSFSGLSAIVERTATLSAGGDSVELAGCSVTADFFAVMGVAPDLGRGFLPGEDRPGGDLVIVLSRGLWQRKFGADPGAVGRTVSLNGKPATIIGVMPGWFDFPFQSNFWRPLQLAPAEESRGSNNLTLIGRLAPGLDLGRGQREMTLIARRLEQAYPDPNKGRGLVLVPLREQLVGKFQRGLAVLLGAACLVLLVACSNVASLLVVRGMGREKEVALRTALGATWPRVARQLLAESTLLAAMAGGGGLLLGIWGGRLLAAAAPEEIPRLGEMRADYRVCIFALLLSCLTLLVSGVAPALRAARADPQRVLNRGRGGLAAGGRAGRQPLVVAELALTVMLLLGAGLLMKSFLLLMRVEPGFTIARLATLDISLPAWKYRPSQSIGFYSRLLERVVSLPGVRSAAATMSRPLRGANHWGTSLTIEGRTLPVPLRGLNVIMNPVTPGYFRTMGIPLLAGRDFAERDDLSTPGVVIVSLRLARLYFPRQNPIGKVITHDLDYGPAATTRTIVGVVGDVRQKALALHEEPVIYVPHRQVPYPLMSLVVRTSGEPLGLSEPLRQTVRDLDTDVPLTAVTTMESIRNGSVGEPRFYMALSAVFAVLALILAAVGVYGVLSQTVARRGHEIGVRMALGARRGQVAALILRQSVTAAAIGCVLGLGAALLLGEVLAKLLYGTAARDPLTYIAVTLLLLAAVLAASYLPARRATRVDPGISLRCE
ncbi:MAG TPA: ABC transporter permease [Thermoanaerobaculia bacterium]|nr:ABC transporter permease [Thermoanaerobaculia bacterium]